MDRRHLRLKHMVKLRHKPISCETGTIALHGPAADIRGNDDVRKAYLGED